MNGVGATSSRQFKFFSLFIVILCGGYYNLSSVSLVRQHQGISPASASASGSLSDRITHGRRSFIPLHDLTQQSPKTNCTLGLVKVEDIIIHSNIQNTTAVSTNRRIPSIIHQTSKSRCLTPTLEYFTQNWKRTLDDHEYYFHDDDAVDRLLHGREWHEFPMLSIVAKSCASKTVKSDLWRYLLLWEYGGIYADTDSVPNDKMFNKSTIEDEDDAFFVIEHFGLLSQYFMAVSPKHPLMGLAIHHTLSKIMLEVDLDTNLQKMAPFISGPHALHFAFRSFMRDTGVVVSTRDRSVKGGRYHSSRYGGRSVTAVGSSGKASDDYVVREAIDKEHKMEEYKKMGMQHFSEVIDNDEAGDVNISRSCASMILEEMTS